MVGICLRLCVNDAIPFPSAVDEMMVVLLDSGKREVVFTAVGVLINLMADEDKRPVLKAQAGIKR